MVASSLLRLPADEAIRRLILDRCETYRRARESADTARELELALTCLAPRFCDGPRVPTLVDGDVAQLESWARVHPVDLRGRAHVPSFGAVLAGLLRAHGAKALADAEEARALTSSWRELLVLAGFAGEGARARLAAAAPADLDGASLEGVRRALEDLAGHLERETEVETERKYLLRELPPFVADRPAMHLLQGYVPGSRIHERLRRVRFDDRTEFVRTVKIGSGLQRMEIEEEISESLFSQMWPLTLGKRLEKLRYEIDDGGYVWVVDQFLDRDLVLAEVELPTVGLEPAIPEWLAPHLVRDVTDESAYVNANLAR